MLQLAGQISENFPQNTLIGTQFENLRKFLEFLEFCQNSENIFDDRTKPRSWLEFRVCEIDPWATYLFAATFEIALFKEYSQMTSHN